MLHKASEWVLHLPKNGISNIEFLVNVNYVRIKNSKIEVDMGEYLFPLEFLLPTTKIYVKFC